MAKKRTPNAPAADAPNPTALLQERYMAYLLEQGHRPQSVYQFTKSLDMPESEFYEHFNSLESLEKAIWGTFLEETLGKIQNDPTFQQYGVREKLLAFYFTLIEGLKARRSYVDFCFKHLPKGMLRPFFLEHMRSGFLSFAQELVNEGQESGEFAQRLFITDAYKDALWLQLRYILKFWLKDESKNFEQTDAAIEKVVNVAFDLMGRTFIDTIVDFVKFNLQKK
jgi:AcrR family transcriptional regulator